MSSDDMSVLNTLLHNIKGISPVAGNPMDIHYLDDDFEAEIC